MKTSLQPTLAPAMLFMAPRNSEVHQVLRDEAIALAAKQADDRFKQSCQRALADQVRANPEQWGIA